VTFTFIGIAEDRQKEEQGIQPKVVQQRGCSGICNNVGVAPDKQSAPREGLLIRSTMGRGAECRLPRRGRVRFLDAMEAMPGRECEA
jgi:hypothetical protein